MTVLSLGLSLGGTCVYIVNYYLPSVEYRSECVYFPHLFITLHKTEKSAKLNPLIITPHIRFFQNTFYLLVV